MQVNLSLTQQREPETIHEKALEILGKVGMSFGRPEAVEIFKKAGANVDGNIIKFPRKIVEEALKSVPSKFEWFGREKSIIVGDGITKNIASYGPIYVNENGQYHEPTLQDFINFTILHETSELLDAACPMVLAPREIPNDILYSLRMALTLMLGTKPTMGMAEGARVAEESIQMIKDFYGKKEGVVAVANINIASPLRISPEMTGALITYAKNGQACIVVGGGAAGLTAPPSLAAVAVQAAAEALGVITLSQLVNPGAPVIMTSSFQTTDLRYNSPAIGGPESALGRVFTKTMGKFYNIPTRAGTGCATDSKLSDYQAGMESMLSLLSTYAVGNDVVLHAFGILDSYNSIGYEKLIMDEECAMYVKRYLRGVEFNENTFLSEKALSISPGANFIAKTQKTYKDDFYMAKLPIRETHGNWLINGCPSMQSKASQEYRKRLAEYKIPEMDSVQKKIIEKYIPEEFMLFKYN